MVSVERKKAPRVWSDVRTGQARSFCYFHGVSESGLSAGIFSGETGSDQIFHEHASGYGDSGGRTVSRNFGSPQGSRQQRTGGGRSYGRKPADHLYERNPV